MNAIAIMVGDDGKVTVGAVPQEMMQEMMGSEEPGEAGTEMGAGKPAAMQPAQDIDSALAIAKDLLANPQAQQAQQAGPAMAPEGGRMMGRMTPQDMAWNKVSADRKAMG